MRDDAILDRHKKVDVHKLAGAILHHTLTTLFIIACVLVIGIASSLISSLIPEYKELFDTIKRIDIFVMTAVSILYGVSLLMIFILRIYDLLLGSDE